MKMILLKIAQFTVLVAIMSLIAAGVKAKARCVGTERFVCYGWPVRGLMLCCLAVVGIMIREVMSGDPRATVIDWRVPCFLAAVAFPTTVEVLVRRVLFSAFGITVISPWTGTRRIPWQEILSIEHSCWLQWHRMRVEGKRSVFLSDLLSGKEELIAAALMRQGGAR